jgi:FADH2 O2-dependent halogenase
LPTAYGFVDPLHSSGIAHALSGVARLSETFLGCEGTVEQQIRKYALEVKNELRWIDTFVGLCYRALQDFEMFLGMCSYYFVSAIGFERDVAKDPMHWPRGYMLSDDRALREEGETTWQAASSRKIITLDQIRRSIAPWNDVGLLSADGGNRLAHTAAKKELS